MEAVLFIVFVVCVVLLIIFALAVGFAGGGWKRLVESVGLVCVVMALAGCDKREPVIVPQPDNPGELHSTLIDYPVPGEQIVVIDGITTTVTTEETTCGFGGVGIQAWVQFDSIPERYSSQPMGAAVDLCGYALAGARVDICVTYTCMYEYSDAGGMVSIDFPKCWEGVGTIPYTVCVEYEGQPKCLVGSFLVEE